MWSGLVLTFLLLGDLPSPSAKPAPRYEFSTFGRDALQRATLVVEARAQSVVSLANGVAVARFDVLDVLKGAKERSVTLLAAPGEFSRDNTYLLFLEPYSGGDRFTSIGRVAEGERDYAAKRRVLEEFIVADAVKDPAERAERIRDVLIKNLGDEDLFVRWNALTELDEFVKVHRGLFGPAEKARIVAVYRRNLSATFRQRVGRLLADVGVRLDAEPGASGGGATVPDDVGPALGGGA